MRTISTAAILVVEVREIEARGIKSALLSRGCTSIHYCFSTDEARNFLGREKADLIVINYDLENGKSW